MPHWRIAEFSADWVVADALNGISSGLALGMPDYPDGLAGPPMTREMTMECFCRIQPHDNPDGKTWTESAMNVVAKSLAGEPPQSVLPGMSVAARTLKWGGGFALVILGGLLLALGWLVAVTKPYEAGSTLGYNMGLAGGIGMLTLLAYPLRKRFPLLQRLGDMQTWFHYHVVIGIAAPVLVLFHSTFHLGSMNGTVAFYSMLTVVASEIGRAHV
jgi:hypothetical protein